MIQHRPMVVVLLLVIVALLVPSFFVSRPHAERTLYVVSPHWEGIKYEFGRGFSAWYQARTGHTVNVEWVDVGGTGRISRYMESEVKRARDTGNVVQIDVIFGGGDYTFRSLADAGVLETVPLPPEIIDDIPAEYGGIDLRDAKGHWFGAALSTFGIIYNKVILQRRGLPEPHEWADLTDTRLFSWVAAADGQSSGSAHTMDEIILQAYGWKRGFSTLTRLMGNARYVAQASSDIPEDIARGDVADGLAIDFYALRQVDLHGSDRLGFVVPANLTIINADPIAKVARCASPDLADAFITYVLGDGQRLWCFRRGAAGGPEKFELGRLPVRRGLYSAPPEQAVLAFNPFATRPAFTYDGRLAGARREQLQGFLAAAFVANHERLAAAWEAVIAAGCPADLCDQLCDPLLESADLVALTAGPKAKEAWARDRFDTFAKWIGLFRAKYLRVRAAALAEEERLMRRHLSTIVFLLLFAAFFGAFLFYPVGFSVRRAFTEEVKVTAAPAPGAASAKAEPPRTRLRFTGRHFATLFRDPTMREGLTNSLSIAVAVTVLTTLIALPLAFWAVRYRFPLKGLLTGLILVPLIMPPFVGAIGVRQLLARYGTVNLLLMDLGLVGEGHLIDFLGNGRFWGVIILEALHLFPIMYLNVVAALANVDPSLEEAGRNLGASGWRLFRTVTFPLMVPGYFAGAVIVFIWAFTDLGTPLVFGFLRVLPVQIFYQVEQVETNPTGFALVVVVLVLTLVLFLLARLVMRGKRYEMMSRAGRGRQERRPGRLHAVLIYVGFLAVFILAVSPHVGVVLTSVAKDWFMTAVPSSFTLDHYREAAVHPLTFSSMRRSVLLASASTVVDVLLGVWIAYMLTRKRFAGRGVIDAVTMLPLALPGVILAFGYLGAFQIGPQSNPLPFLVVAYSIRRLPYMVRSATAGLQQTSVTLEEASLNLGAGPLRTLRKITVPLVSANLIAGAVLAFSFAVLEVSDSLILALREPFYPITKAIYQIFSRLGDGAYVASALGVWASLFLAVTLVTAGVFLGRRLGELFRAS